MLNRKSPRDGERGQVLLLFVACFTVLLVFAAITIDQGLWLGHRRVAQKDADAAARAGAAQYIKALSAGNPASWAYDAAGAAALDLATRNGAPTVTAAADFSPSACANSTNTDQTCARPDCPTIDPGDPSQPGAPIVGAPSIEIAVPRPAPALFLRAFGVGDADTIGAKSTACVGSPTTIVPGPIDALPLMVHYDDAADPTNPAPCFDGLIPRMGDECIIETKLTALLYPPAPGACEGPSVSTQQIYDYLVSGLNGTNYVCTINACADTYSGGLCAPVPCASTPPYLTDCLRQDNGALGSNDVKALSDRLINGETGTGKCWLRTDGSDALAAFKTAFARADGEPVGGPPGLGGTDAPGTLYVKRQCDTGRLVLVFITEVTHTNSSSDYPVLAFALVYLTSCQGQSDPTPPVGTLNWCDSVSGFGNVLLRGVPLRLILEGSISGGIRPPTPGQPLVIQTTR